MTSPSLAGLAGAATLTLAITMDPTLGHSSDNVISADEIVQILKGKTCMTKGGAKFTFTRDGHYAYEGLWTSGGHYSIGDGVVTVLFDSGLARNFTMSKQGGVIYMERTVISCE